MFDEIRVFPRRTILSPSDNLVSFGKPNEYFLSMDRDREVLISVIFTWDISYGYDLMREWKKYFRNTRIGGPAISHYMEYNNGEFEVGKFVKKGVVFTSRGCCNRCAQCMVPEKEGSIYELSIKKGNQIEDSNLLACSDDHIKSVFQMIRENGYSLVQSGGVDVRLFKDQHFELLESVKVETIYFACDKKENLGRLKYIHDRYLKNKPFTQKYVFTLLGFRESIEESVNRYNEVAKIGMIPIPSLYQPYIDRKLYYDIEQGKRIDNKLIRELTEVLQKG